MANRKPEIHKDQEKEKETPDIKQVESLSADEWAVIEIIRSIQYGEAKIIVQNGTVVRVEEVRKSIKI